MARSDFKSAAQQNLLGLEQSSVANFDNAVSSAVKNLARSLINPVYQNNFNYIQQQLAIAEDQIIVDSAMLLDPSGDILHVGNMDSTQPGVNFELSPEEMGAIRQNEIVMNTIF